jgi:hypothetical protein
MSRYWYVIYIKCHVCPKLCIVEKKMVNIRNVPSGELFGNRIDWQYI